MTNGSQQAEENESETDSETAVRRKKRGASIPFSSSARSYKSAQLEIDWR